MAAAGVIFRAIRWLTAAVRPNKKWAGLQERRPTDNDELAGSEGDSLRRAREQVLMQADGTRVPVDVIPSLTASELEVRIFLENCVWCGVRNVWVACRGTEVLAIPLWRLVHMWE